MVEIKLHDGNAGTVRDVVHLLARTSPRFPFAEIAQMCLTAGLLNVREADILKRRAIIPERLLKQLNNVLSMPVEVAIPTSKNYEVPLHQETGNLTLTPPVAHCASRDLAGRFKTRSIPKPNMFVTHGELSTHFVHRCLNISWSSDGMITPKDDPNARFYLNFLRDVDPKHLSGRTFLCVVRGSRNYAHWLLDTIPRLLALIETGENLNEFDHFVFLSMKYNFHIKSMEEFGISPQRIINLEDQSENSIDLGGIFKTDKFTFVSDPRQHLVPCANIAGMMRSFFVQSRGIRPTKRKIFISRSKAPKRRILNEDELVGFLESLGYERVWLEDFSIRETASIMAEAKAVIGPHGAGMTNLIFASPGTKALELFSSRLTSSCWKLANQNNLNYYAFETGGPDGKPFDPMALANMPGYMHNMDMTISMPEFKDFVINEFERDRE